MLKYETKVIKVNLKYFNYMLSYLLCILVMKGKVILGSTLNLKYEKELETIVKPSVYVPINYTICMVFIIHYYLQSILNLYPCYLTHWLYILHKKLTQRI